MEFTASFQPVWVTRLVSSNTKPRYVVHDLNDAFMAAHTPVSLILDARSDARAPLSLLPYLAAERSVDEFKGSWPEERQRAVVAGSFRYHQAKGTRPALDRALNPLGFADLKVVEWFENTPTRPANTFALRVTIPVYEPWYASDRFTVVRVANNAKNAHTLLERVEIVRAAPPANAYVHAVVRRRRRLDVVQPPRRPRLDAQADVFCGVVPNRTRRVVIVQPARLLRIEDSATQFVGAWMARRRKLYIRQLLA